METDEELRGVLLEARVQRFYAAYAGAVDRADEGALRALATDDVAITRGGATERGLEGFLGVYRAHWAQGIPLCQHSVTNIAATSSRGRVRATAYFRAIFFDAAETRMAVGWYEDDLVDGPVGLRVTHKRNHVQRVLTLPASTDLEGGVA